MEFEADEVMETRQKWLKWFESVIGETKGGYGSANRVRAGREDEHAKVRVVVRVKVSFRVCHSASVAADARGQSSQPFS